MDAHGDCKESLEEAKQIENAKLAFHEYRSECAKLKGIIQKEREDRKRAETEALEILRTVREKYENKLSNLKTSAERQLREAEERHRIERNTFTSDDYDLLKLKLDEVQMNLVRKENEISNLRLDMKIHERDATRAQDQTKYLREMNRELKEKISQLESNAKQAQLEHQEKIEEIQNMKNELAKKERTISDNAQDFQSKHLILEERIKALQEQCKASKDLEKSMSNWQGKYEECNRNNESLCFKVRELENECMKLKRDIDSSNTNLQGKNETIDKLRLANSKLMRTCSELEKQLDVYQNLFEGKIEENKRVVEESVTLMKKEQKFQSELRRVQEQLALAEKQRDEVQIKYEAERNHFETQVNLQKERIRCLENSLQMECENSSQFTKNMNELQTDAYEKNLEIQRLNAEITQLQRELLIIKEEASRHITTISDMKAQHQSLTRMYDEMSEKYNLSKTRFNTLLDEIDVKESNTEKEMLRLNETVNQLKKANAFLQSELEKPHKKFSWFGTSDAKNSKTPILTPASENKKVNHVRELESALDRERAKNKILLEQINDTNLELLNCKKELKRRLDREAKAIIEGSLNLCSPAKKRNYGIYENLKESNDAKEFVRDQLNRLCSGDISPSAPPLTNNENNSDSSMTTAEATETYFLNQDLHVQRPSQTEVEEFTFTDSVLNDLSFTK